MTGEIMYLCGIFGTAIFAVLFVIVQLVCKIRKQRILESIEDEL